jgi:hypothetical protein
MNNDTNGLKEHFVGGFTDEIEMINHEHHPNEAHEDFALKSNTFLTPNTAGETGPSATDKAPQVVEQKKIIYDQAIFATFSWAIANFFFGRLDSQDFATSCL